MVDYRGDADFRHQFSEFLRQAKDIAKQKGNKNLTFEKISKESDVPDWTVKRIFAGKPIRNETDLQNIVRVAEAVCGPDAMHQFASWREARANGDEDSREIGTTPAPEAPDDTPKPDNASLPRIGSLDEAALDHRKYRSNHLHRLERYASNPLIALAVLVLSFSVFLSQAFESLKLFEGRLAQALLVAVISVLFSGLNVAFLFFSAMELGKQTGWAKFTAVLSCVIYAAFPLVVLIALVK